MNATNNTSPIVVDQAPAYDPEDYLAADPRHRLARQDADGRWWFVAADSDDMLTVWEPDGLCGTCDLYFARTGRAVAEVERIRALTDAEFATYCGSAPTGWQS